MLIDGRTIGDGPPYIIAEVSCSHCGSLDKALELIEAAKWAGADAVKFQCYSPDSITLNCDKPDFVIKDGLWKGKNLYELYTVTQTPYEWFPLLFERARKVGISILSSVFAETAVDLLESLGCPAYKIASMEVTDTNLISYVAQTQKPIIISTGMATMEEIGEVIGSLKSKYTDIHSMVAFLHCTSGYPAPIEESALHLLGLYRGFNTSNYISGISDHTQGWEVPVATTALRADIIEKHICMSRSDPTEDATFSLEPAEFREMVNKVHAIWRAMQRTELATSENPTRQLRRSLYVTSNIKAGEKFTKSNIRSIRPSYGLSPIFYNNVLGKNATRDIEYGEALSVEMIDGNIETS